MSAAGGDLIDVAFHALRSAQVESLDAVRAQRVLAQLRQLSSFCDAMTIVVARRLETLREAGSAGRPEVVLGRVLGKREAGRVAVRSAVVAQAPVVGDALSAGVIGSAHVDAIVAAITTTPAVVDHAAQLATTATMMPPDEFAVHCRRIVMLLADDGGVDELARQRANSRVRHWVDRFSGMYHLHAQLDPERGAELWAAIDAGIEQHFHGGVEPELDNDQRAAVAVHALATSGGGTVATTVHVHVDLDTLVDGLHKQSTVEVTGGGMLPVTAVRRLACEAGIIPYVLNGDGVVVDVGREQRLATRRQRHTLRAMYPTCAMPDCTVSFEHTRIHHITPFTSGGRTDVANMVPLCDRHHHDVHDGGWQIHLDPTNRQLSVQQPDGTLISHTPLRHTKRRTA